MVSRVGRRLRIAHHSGYRYISDVHASFNEVRMTPSDADGQVLIYSSKEAAEAEFWLGEL